MARLYTRRVLGTSTSAPPNHETRVVPVGEAWVIRDLTVYFEDPTATQAFFQMVTAGSYFFAGVFAAADGKFQHLDVRQVLNEGEQLVVYVDAGSARVGATAYKFLL